MITISVSLAEDSKTAAHYNRSQSTVVEFELPSNSSPEQVKDILEEQAKKVWNAWQAM